MESDKPLPNKCEFIYNTEQHKVYYRCSCYYNLSKCVYGSGDSNTQCKYCRLELFDNIHYCDSLIAKANTQYRLNELRTEENE